MVDISGDGRKGAPPEPDTSTEILGVLAVLRREVKELREQVDALADDSPEEPDDQLLTRKEAASRLRISTRLLDDLADQGEINSVPVRGRVLYQPDEIDRYIRAQAGEGGHQ
jgi:excisionase family DNA binding protein